ncbi:MAG: cytochrome c [Sedimenticola sp.]
MKEYIRCETAAIVTLLSLPLISWAVTPLVDRWYSQDQVEIGAILFATHCSGCHGKKAEGALNWKVRLPNGSLPPPPLNGTAHSWHHQIPVLRRAINEGGNAFGGNMPGFKEKLSEPQIDAVIAWFQSLWSDEIYSLWSGQGVDMIDQPEIIKELLDGI